MKEKFTLGELKDVINLFEQNGVDYYVVGGFALEVVGGISREHEDLDLVVNKNDEQKLTQILKGRGYKPKIFGRLTEYKRKEQDLIYKIETLWMKTFNHFYRIRGNWVENKISREDFNSQNYVDLGKIKFRTMPFEWFSLYQDVTHCCPEKTEYLKKAIGMILPFCKKMKILSQKPVKRLKSDPKNKN